MDAVIVIFHDRSSPGRLRLGLLNNQEHDMMYKLPAEAVVKIGMKDNGLPIEVSVGGAARFYLDNVPSGNPPREGYWDIYTEQTGHQFCLGEVRRPRTWEELVRVVRAAWATIPEREMEYQRELAAMEAYEARYAQERLEHKHNDDTEDDDFTDDDEEAAYARTRLDRPRQRRNSDLQDNDI